MKKGALALGFLALVGAGVAGAEQRLPARSSS